MDIVQKSTILQELIQQSYEEGQRKATLKAIRLALSIRFDTDPKTLDDQLNCLDLPTLKNLFETALTASTLPEFEAALTDLLTPPDTE